MSWLSKIFKSPIFLGGIFGSLFDKPSAPKAPPLPAPTAIPSAGGGEAEQTAAARQRRRKGMMSTILTGNVAPTGAKKKLLGG